MEVKKIKLRKSELLYLINDFLKTDYKFLWLVPRRSLYKIITFFLLARKGKEAEQKKSLMDLVRSHKRKTQIKTVEIPDEE
jgi:hypothetical protein